MGEEKRLGRERIRQHWPLLVISVVYLILTIVYTWTIPPFEGPDEAQHFAYITWLAEGKGFPPQGDAAWLTPIQQEAGQSPLYYLLATLPARLVDLTSPRAVFRENIYAFTGPGPHTNNDNDNRALHYPEDARPLAGGWLALYLARGLSMAFGILLLVSVYGLVREVFPDVPEIAWAASWLLAVTPQVLFISSVASNDIPAAAFSALALWLLAVLVRQGPTPSRAAALGAAFGLAIITKTSAAALGLPILAAFAWLWLSGRHSFKHVMWTGCWMTLSVFIVAGWWLIHSWYNYGSPLGLETHDLTPWAIHESDKLAAFHRRWIDVFRSYWVSLGWGTIRPPDWVYHILAGLSLAAVSGLLLAFRRWWRRSHPRQTTRIILLILLCLAVLGVGLSLEMWMRRVIAPYGRLMFPAAAAITVLLVTGWHKLHRRLPYVIAGLVTILAIVTPFWLAVPAFSHPTPLEEKSITDLSPKIGWRYGLNADMPLVELLSSRLLERSVEIGKPLAVELCWLPLAQSNHPYIVLVHIIGPENHLIVHRRTHPGLGRLPTTIWQPGEAFCDVVGVETFNSPHQTMVYQVEVALLDETTNTRVPAYDSLGNRVEATFANRVQLIDGLAPPWSPESTTESGEAFLLLDYELPQHLQSGQEDNLKLEWGVAQPVDKDYQIFVHFRDPATGENVAQADGPPLKGWYPTSWWVPGTTIVDDRVITLSPQVPPGTYDLVIGFYDLETVQPFGPEHRLGTVEVKP